MRVLPIVGNPRAAAARAIASDTRYALTRTRRERRRLICRARAEPARIFALGIVLSRGARGVSSPLAFCFYDANAGSPSTTAVSAATRQLPQWCRTSAFTQGRCLPLGWHHCARARALPARDHPMAQPLSPAAQAQCRRSLSQVSITTLREDRQSSHARLRSHRSRGSCCAALLVERCRARGFRFDTRAPSAPDEASTAKDRAW
jgi:hypothetical protein